MYVYAYIYMSSCACVYACMHAYIYIYRERKEIGNHVKNKARVTLSYLSFSTSD